MYIFCIIYNIFTISIISMYIIHYYTGSVCSIEPPLEKIFTLNSISSPNITTANPPPPSPTTPPPPPFTATTNTHSNSYYSIVDIYYKSNFYDNLLDLFSCMQVILYYTVI